MNENYGQYRLIDRVASGGMGEIFKAKFLREAGFEKIVAVKRILPGLAEHPGFEDRFCNEARLAARLNHANIVQIYDFGKHSGSLFLSMEFVDGVDLANLLDRLRDHGEALPLTLSLRIIADVCKGLDYAHRLKDESGRELKVIHRDISPSNILISFEGEVKLTDFGLACAREEAGRDVDKLAGKICYLPPEQVRGDPSDRRSDIYSVGLVLYEMLYGRRAFSPHIPEEALLRGIAAGAMDFPESDNLPESVRKILVKACSNEKAERYDTAQAMLREVEEEIVRHHVPGGEELPRLLVRLFPDRAQPRAAVADRTILSTRPIGTPRKEFPEKAETPGAESTAIPDSSPPKSKKGPLLLVVLLLLLTMPVGAFLFRSGGAVLELKSTPPGARVLLDGLATRQVTPALLKGLDPDRSHRIRLELRGYDPYEETVSFGDERKKTSEIRLVPGLQETLLETRPPGARAWLNGRELEGVTPMKIGKLPLGRKHRLRIERDGYVPVQTEFIIEEKSEEPHVLSHPLASLYKELEIRTTPTGASLLLDGRPVKGKSPFLLADLIPNRPVTLTASLEGYNTVEKSVVPGKEPGPIQLQLSPFECTLTVEASGDGRILSGGRNHGHKMRLPEAQNQVRLLSVLPSENATERLLIRARIFQGKDSRGRCIPMAELNFDAKPWATIRIDGGAAFTTPSSGKRLRAGRHRLSYALGKNTKEYETILHIY